MEFLISHSCLEINYKLISFQMVKPPSICLTNGLPKASSKVIARNHPQLISSQVFHWRRKRWANPAPLLIVTHTKIYAHPSFRLRRLIWTQEMWIQISTTRPPLVVKMRIVRLSRKSRPKRCRCTTTKVSFKFSSPPTMFFSRLEITSNCTNSLRSLRVLFSSFTSPIRKITCSKAILR